MACDPPVGHKINGLHQNVRFMDTLALLPRNPSSDRQGKKKMSFWSKNGTTVAQLAQTHILQFINQ